MPIKTSNCAGLQPFVQERDNINPDHYFHQKKETIDIIKDIMSNDFDGYEGFCIGNIVKYISRFKRKNGAEDLRKAQWYLGALLQYVEKGEKHESN